MKIQTSNNPAKELANDLATAITSHAGETLCLYAGGSALKVFKYLQLDASEKVRTIFCAGDERVSGRDGDSNYIQLLQKLPADHNLTIVDTLAKPNESVTDFAKRISDFVKKEILTKSDLQIISIHGIGTDGHTAGIFPMTEDKFLETYKEDVWYASVYLESLIIARRASITPAQVLNHADQVLGYAVGADKKLTLEILIEIEKPIHEMPSQLLKHHKKATLYTDQVLESTE